MKFVDDLLMGNGYAPGFVCEYDTSAPLIGHRLALGINRKKPRYKDVEFRWVGARAVAQVLKSGVVDIDFRLSNDITGVTFGGVHIDTAPFNLIHIEGGGSTDRITFGRVYDEEAEAVAIPMPFPTTHHRDAAIKALSANAINEILIAPS